MIFCGFAFVIILCVKDSLLICQSAASQKKEMMVLNRGISFIRNTVGHF